MSTVSVTSMPWEHCLQVLVLKESTEVREVAVPPLALTADGRAIGEAPAQAGSAATSPRELALALALQVT